MLSEYGMTNASISSVALPLTATPQLVESGNKIVIHLGKRTKVKITDIAYIGLLRVLTDQCMYLKLGFTPDRNPKGVIKSGNKIDMYLCKKSNSKTSVISHLRVPEYGMVKGSNFMVAFTPDSTPKRGQKGQQKLHLFM